MQDGGRPPTCPKIQTGISSSSTQDRDIMSSSVVGFSGTADLMVKMQDNVKRPFRVIQGHVYWSR